MTDLLGGLPHEQISTTSSSIVLYIGLKKKKAEKLELD